MYWEYCWRLSEIVTLNVVNSECIFAPSAEFAFANLRHNISLAQQLLVFCLNAPSTTRLQCSFHRSIGHLILLFNIYFIDSMLFARLSENGRRHPNVNISSTLICFASVSASQLKHNSCLSVSTS